ncbi:lytic transglycosylase domain-containing protein [Sphingobium yanoikuyae]|uniref:lytic transglycosylase domain-containing protein n=1 Tax=Sphingobium yanoikuyae TaxID=13690 RepID=UPI0022DD9DCD|nr:lytic transglycosylase domain-containing protein [Sphingobium yanoikuyae]WBQ17740.1 lytic transglycosylase domain-containing protein [Sphingobium yanoikuyae]
MRIPLAHAHKGVGLYAVPAFVACILLLSGSAAAASRPVRSAAAEREIARCIQSASAGRSWLEKTLWGLRDQEAGWIGAEVLNTNGTHDLGPLQVNSSWIPKFAALTGRPAPIIRYWLINDPCFNVQAARWLFLAGLRTTGDYWKAVGVYHSPTDWRQRRYAGSVAGHLRRRFGEAVFD